MSLYGKYRPQNFTNLVGQEHIRQTLLHEIQNGLLSHAYLFTGPRGTGKTTTARLIAKALNCTNKNPEGEPCDECEFCTTIKDGSLIDVIEIDAASNRGIDEIRDLKEKINFAPTRAKTKTYIIDEVHMLTKEAFNALLKTLEEPPENVYFILCTTEIHKIPETIISRCQRFDFKRIDVKTIMTRLNYIAQMEKIEVQDAAIELIARHVEGGMRDAIGLLEQMTIDNKLLSDHVRSHLGITGHSTITTLLDLLEKKDTIKSIHLVNEVHNEGYDLTSFVREILECLRDRLITGIQQNQEDSDLWLLMITHFEEARDMLRYTVIPQLPLEIAVIKICGAGKTKGTDVEQQEKAEESEAELTKQETETVQEIKKEYEMEKYNEVDATMSHRGNNNLAELGLDLGDVGKHWARVVEHVQPPSLRRSLGDAKVSENADGTVTLVFGSRFHMEKVNLVENRAKIEKAIAHIFKKTAKVTCTLEIREIVQSQEQDKTRLIKKSKNTGDMAKKALEIFGGEEI